MGRRTWRCHVGFRHLEKRNVAVQLEETGQQYSPWNDAYPLAPLSPELHSVSRPMGVASVAGEMKILDNMLGSSPARCRCPNSLMTRHLLSRCFFNDLPNSLICQPFPAKLSITETTISRSPSSWRNLENANVGFSQPCQPRPQRQY
jgi:hypothetical protein